MNILAIPATNSIEGMNYQLLKLSERLLTEGIVPSATVDFVDINDYEMPIYSPAREADGGVPGLAKDLFARIGQADAIVISYAEYNGSYTAAWKNIYDWMSRIEQGVWQGKRVVMLAATPGPRGGQGVLGAATTTAPFFGAEVTGSFGLPSFHNNFDAETGDITDPALRDSLVAALSTLGG